MTAPALQHADDKKEELFRGVLALGDVRGQWEPIPTDTCALTPVREVRQGAAVDLIRRHSGALLAVMPGARVTHETAALRSEKLGQNVYVIDPFALGKGQGDTLNILDLLDADSPDLPARARAMAKTMLQRYTDTEMLREELVNKGRPFMHRRQAAAVVKAAQDLLTGMILFAKVADADVLSPAQRSLPGLSRPFGLFQEGWRDFMKLMRGHKGAHRALIVPEGESFDVKYEDRITAKAKRMVGDALSFARHPRVAPALATSSFDVLSALKDGTASLYVVLPDDTPMIETASPFVRAFVEAAASATERGDWLVAIDDYHKMGRIALPGDIKLWAGAPSHKALEDGAKPEGFKLRGSGVVQRVAKPAHLRYQ